MRISSYKLTENVYDIQPIYLPKDCKIISANIKEDGMISLYVLNTDITLDYDLRKFKVVNTDETIYNEKIHYIGTYETAFGIKHLIEVFD